MKLIHRILEFFRRIYKNNKAFPVINDSYIKDKNQEFSLKLKADKFNNKQIEEEMSKVIQNTEILNTKNKEELLEQYDKIETCIDTLIKIIERQKIEIVNTKLKIKDFEKKISM